MSFFPPKYLFCPNEQYSCSSSMAMTGFLKSNEDCDFYCFHLARLICESIKEEQLDDCIRKLYLCENQEMNICVLLAHRVFRTTVNLI